MQVILSKDAAKNFKRLPQFEQKKVKKKLILLENNPLAGKILEGEFEDKYSIRAWPYRIIYKFNKKEKRVEVSAILHRQGAYK